MSICFASIPDCLKERFMRSRISFINLNETITREYREQVINEIYKAVENRPVGAGASQKYIFIIIHCNGGSIYESFRIINAIEMAKRFCIVATVIDSIAFSTAAAIFCAGSNGFRFVGPNAQVMIHRPTPKHSDVTILGAPHLYVHPCRRCGGRAKDEDEKLHMAVVQKQIIKAILKPLRHQRPVFTERFLIDLEQKKDRDWFLDADDMLYYGLADYDGVPSVMHHVQYHPVLLFDDKEIHLS